MSLPADPGPCASDAYAVIVGSNLCHIVRANPFEQVGTCLSQLFKVSARKGAIQFEGDLIYFRELLRNQSGKSAQYDFAQPVFGTTAIQREVVNMKDIAVVAQRQSFESCDWLRPCLNIAVWGSARQTVWYAVVTKIPDHVSLIPGGSLQKT
uniref:Uncharacterized protein n=1 Tax=Rhizobium leguminosarum bv. trifolii TaxID=386 RepID=A0A1C9HWZ3_RHILT|nr:hypothetical protein [Rhizobium leguminosarum bv. trifolii]